MHRTYLLAVFVTTLLSPLSAYAETPAELLRDLQNYTVTYDSAGNPMPTPDSMQHTLAYSGGLLSTDTATDGTSTWIQTFSYTSGDLTGISYWVKQ